MMGYTINLLEYYDDSGTFHKNNYSDEFGFVTRTLDHYDEKHRYYHKDVPQFTSLVFDAFKPEDCKKMK